MRARTKRWATIAIALAIASLSLPASAASIDDPNFARGPLDLKRLTATKHDAGAPLRLTVVTWETWPANTLDVNGGNRIFVYFNTDHSGPFDFVGEVRFGDGALWMRIEDAAGHFVHRVRAFHPAGDVVRVTVPAGLPNPNGHAWIAAGERWVTARGSWYDRAPQQGWLKVTPGQ